MIPTGYKIKIPGDLSYLLRAKAISESLAGVPQIDSMTIDFWFHPFSVGRRPYRVLSASYSQTSLNPLYRKFHMYVGRFDSGWRITVETVPRHLRHSVQSKLLTEALPNVKRWLIANHDTSGRTGGQSLVFRFDESYEELRSEENATLDWKTVRVEGELHD